MTATTATDVDRRQLAEHLLDRSGLELNPGVDRDQALTLLTKILVRYHPPDTPHGRLVVLALLPRPGVRPPEELAVRRIVCGGRAPTPRAVAGQLKQTAESAAAWQARLARLRPLVDRVGPAAAAAAESLWLSRRKAPSPALLGQALGWPKRDVWAFVTVLVESGWLGNEGRRLTPGPRARGSAG